MRRRPWLAAASLLGFLCLALVLSLAPARVALAEDAVQDATLTLKMEYQSGEDALLIDGVEATVYRVASLDDAVNHYELARDGADCVNVRTGEHIRFSGYDDYSEFICTFEKRYPRIKRRARKRRKAK